MQRAYCAGWNGFGHTLAPVAKIATTGETVNNMAATSSAKRPR